MSRKCVICGVVIATAAMLSPEVQSLICKSCEKKEIGPHAHQEEALKVIDFSDSGLFTSATGSTMGAQHSGQLDQLRKENESN